MQSLLRFLAVLVAIAFVITTLFVVVMCPWLKVGSRAELYKDVLANERIYERMPALVGESLRTAAAAREHADGDGEGGAHALSEALRELDAEDWNTLLGAAVPASVLRAEVERGLDAAEQFLHAGVATDAAAISLVEVKRRLAGPPLTEAYAAMLARKPPCTPAQWESSMGVPVSCRPSPDQMAEAIDNFGRIAQAMAGELPDSIPLLDGLERLAGPEGDFAQIESTRSTIRQAEAIGHWSPVVPIAMALLIALLAVRTFRGLLLWWGIPCFIAGVIATLVAGGFTGVGIAMMNGFATADLPPDAPVAIVDAILDVVSGLVRALMAPALLGGALLCGGGLAALVLAFVLRPKAVPPPMTRG
ncbi:MAG: hypothetical protein IAE82_07095 [Opitutaceae bacterium]|nr:hypothetical protein [Opitutaceae bacterium]